MNEQEYRPFVSHKYILINGKEYVYSNDDDPTDIYTRYDNKYCFIAQPTRVPTGDNIITIPLMMSDEWDIIRDDPTLIEDLRQSKKEYDFTFVGQCHYNHREIFKSLQTTLDKYDFEETAPIWSVKKDKKRRILIEYLSRISRSKFVFAPRGVGSSSFRAYQAMCVGSVPIITDMIDYPFHKHIDWDSMCLRGPLSNINVLINTATHMSNAEYVSKRDRAMHFWDNYCKHDKLYEKLCGIVSNKL